MLLGYLIVSTILFGFFMIVWSRKPGFNMTMKIILVIMFVVGLFLILEKFGFVMRM